MFRKFFAARAKRNADIAARAYFDYQSCCGRSGGTWTFARAYALQQAWDRAEAKYARYLNGSFTNPTCR